MRTYRCTVCGYEYVPAANGNVSFTALPAEWKCPRCGKSKDKFNPVG
ncbi:MAG TPA: rubredoxin [bacterium]|nr:rubredoxin [bacterium]